MDPATLIILIPSQPFGLGRDQHAHL